MPFKLACWNVQRLAEGSSEYKTDVVNQWLAIIDADVLGLIEVAADMEIAGYTLQGYVNTLDKNFNGTQLCIAAYLKTGSALSVTGARALRHQDTDNQRRAQLKVNILDGQVCYPVYFSHATASKGGGIDAVGGSLSQVAINKKCIVLGDFNYNLTLDMTMLDVQNNPQCEVIESTTILGTVTKTHKGGGHLDFCMTGTQANVVASPLPKAYGNWKTIDHAPIAYLVT